MTVRKAENVLQGLAVLLLLALMMVTVVDVVGRYFLNAPLSGAFEMTELILGALVFVSLPMVSRAGAHVEVDLLVSLLPARINKKLEQFSALVSALVLVGFSWRLGVLGVQQMDDGARSVSLEVPLPIFAFLGAVTCLLSAFLGVLREFTHD